MKIGGKKFWGLMVTLTAALVYFLTTAWSARKEARTKAQIIVCQHQLKMLNLNARIIAEDTEKYPASMKSLILLEGSTSFDPNPGQAVWLRCPADLEQDRSAFTNGWQDALESRISYELLNKGGPVEPVGPAIRCQVHGFVVTTDGLVHEDEAEAQFFQQFNAK